MPYYAARATVLLGNTHIRLRTIVKAKNRRLAIGVLLKKYNLHDRGTLLDRGAFLLKGKDACGSTFNPYQEIKQ